jgi:hypothetical protein
LCAVGPWARTAIVPIGGGASESQTRRTARRVRSRTARARCRLLRSSPQIPVPMGPALAPQRLVHIQSLSTLLRIRPDLPLWHFLSADCWNPTPAPCTISLSPTETLSMSGLADARVFLRPNLVEWLHNRVSRMPMEQEAVTTAGEIVRLTRHCSESRRDLEELRRAARQSYLVLLPQLLHCSTSIFITG